MDQNLFWSTLEISIFELDQTGSNWIKSTAEVRSEMNQNTGQYLSLIVTPSSFKGIFHSIRNFFAYRFEAHLLKENLFYHSVFGSISINDLE